MMPRFVVDLWLDGYDTEEEMEKACWEFIREQLNFSGSSVTVSELEAVLSAAYKEGRDEAIEHGDSR